jgi:DNA-binding transcriptional ArsR family regulator
MQGAGASSRSGSFPDARRGRRGRHHRRVLGAYWEAAFGQEWQHLEELLAQSVAEAEHMLATDGAWAVLGRLPAHCKIGPDARELHVELPHDHRVEASPERPLVLSPSFFAWPHLIVSCDEPWPLALVYTAPVLAREALPQIPSSDLVRTLSAVADDTRLRILKLIAERPRTAQEMEPLVGLSRAGLSKALRRLADAGLIVGRRESYYVVYSLASERVNAIGPALSSHLDGRNGTPFFGLN